MVHSTITVGLTNPSGLLLPIIHVQFVTHLASDVRGGSSTDYQPALPVTIVSLYGSDGL